MAASRDEAKDVLIQTAIVVHIENAQKMRRFLEEDGYWDSCRRLLKLKENVIFIPVQASISSAIRVSEHEKSEMLQHRGKVLKSGHYRDLPCHLVSVSLPPSKKQLAVSPHKRLVNALRGRFDELDIPFPEELQADIPDSWEKHEDLILLPQLSFQSTVWECCHDLWPTIAGALGGRRVARKGRVKQDEFRSPRVELLLGDDGWVEHKDNGIRYAYDVRHCMFSVGNVTEKMRVARFDCRGETVVDLYAGIGYFTLPYLVHAKASVVHACEWNPDAVTALKNNLVLNGVQERCVVHQGDNKQVCPRGVADRVNLGLIPTSEEGWPIACAALKPQSGGVLHIHGNVTSRAKTTMPGRTRSRNLVALEGGMSPCSLRTASEVSLSPTGLRTANPIDLNSREGPKLCLLLPDFKFVDLGKNCSSRDDFKVTEDNCSRRGDETDQYRPSNNVKYSSELKPAEQSIESVTSDDAELAPTDYWSGWAQSTAREINKLLADIQGGRWTTEVTHVEHVKSYAPHVDHIVADIRCQPLEHNTDVV